MKKNSKVKNLEEYRDKKINNEYNEKKSCKKKKKSKTKKKYRPLFILIIFAILSILFFMYRYSIISNLKYEIQSLNKELENSKNKKKELYIQLENLSNSGYIEKKAREKLQMDYPKEEQIVYIKLD